MKRLITLCLLFVATVLCACAQNLTQQMFNLYQGHVKTLVQRIEGMSGEAITQFDKNGKVLSFQQGDSRMEYSWKEENSGVEISGYVNGQYQGSQMFSISDMSSTDYKYETGGISFAIKFKSNGAISKQTISANGQTQTSFYYYKRQDDLMPYKIVTSMGGRSLSVNVEILSTDYYGNPTKFTQTSNGQTLTTMYEISYY